MLLSNLNEAEDNQPTACTDLWTCTSPCVFCHPNPALYEGTWISPGMWHKGANRESWRNWLKDLRFQRPWSIWIGCWRGWGCPEMAEEGSPTFLTLQWKEGMRKQMLCSFVYFSLCDLDKEKGIELSGWSRGWFPHETGRRFPFQTLLWMGDGRKN